MTPLGRVKKNTDAAGLNGSAYRNQTFCYQIIKSRQNAFIPGVCQICFYGSDQRSKPVSLPGSANTGFPLAGLHFGGDA